MKTLVIIFLIVLMVACMLSIASSILFPNGIKSARKKLNLSKSRYRELKNLCHDLGLEETEPYNKIQP